VPQVAIQETIEGKFFLLTDDQNQVVQRFIKTGAREGALLVVESGLEAGIREKLRRSGRRWIAGAVKPPLVSSAASVAVRCTVARSR